jgi:heat shock protein HslJ
MKIKIKIIGPCLPFFLCLLFFPACQQPTAGASAHPAAAHLADTVTVAVAPVSRTPDTTTLGGLWYLQPVLESDTATGKTPWLELNLFTSKFRGNTGCNSMRGQFWFSKTDSSLTFGDKFATTKMACPGYNEPAFLNSLRNTAHFRLRNGVLSLVGDDNAELSRWMRHQATLTKTSKA